jgi:O-antigen ligase
MAVYVKHTVIPPTDPGTGLAVLQTATTHGDSMLFASAFVLLILMVVERAGKRPVRLALLLLPILVWGMASNNRRLVWVHVALILITLYLVMPDNNFKRKFRRLIYYSLPAIGLYMIAGWNSEYGRLFKPVRIARSIIEPQSDGSSLWRELENFNLIVTVKQSPIIGFGYGHKFIEAIPLPAVNYSLEYYCPHNSLLGLWAFAGFIGYTAITMMWGVGVYFAMRGYHNAKDPRDRVAAVLSVGAVLVYLVQAFGDIGLGSLTGISLLAPALAIAGKLAVATGSWGATRQPAAAQPAPPGGAPPHPLGRPQLAPAGRGRVR